MGQDVTDVLQSKLLNLDILTTLLGFSLEPENYIPMSHVSSFKSAYLDNLAFANITFSS